MKFVATALIYEARIYEIHRRGQNYHHPRRIDADGESRRRCGASRLSRSFHAAQAYIFERTGMTFKTHNGVQTEFSRLTKEDVRADPILRRFLSQSYEYKSVADDFTGAEAVTSAAEAGEAVATSKRFLAHFAQLALLAGSGDAP